MFQSHRPAQSVSLARCCIAVCLVSILGVGCGGKPGTGDKTTSDSPAIKKVSAAKLPELDDYLPPLDDGKIQLAPPKGWKVLPRDNKYLTRIVLSDPIGLPRILVTVEESMLEGIDTATADNVVEFASATATSLKERKAATLEAAKPMIIGDNAFVRYVLKSKLGKTTAIERQMLQTVAGGRLYTVDLQVAEGEIPKHRDVAYAMAAGLKFTDGATAAKPPEGEPPAAAP